MKSGAGDFHVHRFSSDDVAERDRLAFVREVYGRVIVKLDIEPHAGSPFRCRSALRRLPGLGLASIDCSGVHTERSRAQIDSDNLILHVRSAGKSIVRQFGREAVAGAGELAVTRSSDVASSDCDPGSRLHISIPVSALAPMIVDLDAALVRVIPADTEPLPLLLKYARFLQTTDVLQQADTRHLVVAHVYDLVALTLGGTRDAAHVAKGRGVQAARLSAIKSDITENLGRSDLKIDVIAARHHVTPRYVRMLFEKENLTFSEFVLRERLALAHRALVDPRGDNRPISDIAFANGFADLSYFNRTFRRRYAASPSEVREAARRGWN